VHSEQGIGDKLFKYEARQFEPHLFSIFPPRVRVGMDLEIGQSAVRKCGVIGQVAVWAA